MKLKIKDYHSQNTDFTLKRVYFFHYCLGLLFLCSYIKKYVRKFVRASSWYNFYTMTASDCATGVLTWPEHAPGVAAGSEQRE